MPKTISDVEKEKLENLDVLVINALRENDHFAHFTISEALQLVEEVKPKRAYLTHFSHEPAGITIFSVDCRKMCFRRMMGYRS